MSTRSAFFKFIGSLVALVLLLHISFSLISASPAEAKEALPTREEEQIAALTAQVEALTRMVEQLSGRETCILLLRIEQTALGDCVTLNDQLLRIAVDRRFYDSCSQGDEITNSPWIESLSEPLVGQIRLFVADKYIDQE